MPFAIGLRFYKISLRRRGQKNNLVIGPGGEPCDLHDFMEDFVARRGDPTVETTEPRVWFFDRKPTNSPRTIHGYISYGTHGFESKFEDLKTRKEKYSRQSSDLEEIPLYFQIWVPDDSTCAMMAFQSFLGRSCVTFVRNALMKDFQHKFPNYIMLFNVVAPAGSVMDERPVKSLTFSRRRSRTDNADAYLLGKKIDEVEVDVSIRAKRRGSYISTFKEIKTMVDGSSGDQIVSFDGDRYESVTAEVQFGRKRRIVGIFGYGIDAGLIEASDKVKRQKSGHPVFDDIADEVDDIMSEFYSGIKT